jgi:hypothetical protein
MINNQASFRLYGPYQLLLIGQIHEIKTTDIFSQIKGSSQ